MVWQPLHVATNFAGAVAVTGASQLATGGTPVATGVVSKKSNVPPGTNGTVGSIGVTGMLGSVTGGLVGSVTGRPVLGSTTGMPVFGSVTDGLVGLVTGRP